MRLSCRRTSAAHGFTSHSSATRSWVLRPTTASSSGNTRKSLTRTANIPTVLVKGDIVFASSAYRRAVPCCGSSHKGKDVGVEEIKFLDRKCCKIITAEWCCVGDYVYCGHGHQSGAPICVEFATGNVAWRQERGVGRGSAAVLYADGNVIFRWEDGTVGLRRSESERVQDARLIQTAGPLESGRLVASRDRARENVSARSGLAAVL